MCTCSRLSYCLGNIVYIFEKLASCCAATSVVTCVVTTLLIMLGVGVGLGYNYCYVDLESGRNKDDDLHTSFKPVDSHVTTSKNGIIVIPTVPSSTSVPVEINSTIIAPLFRGIDFNNLIENIKERKHNVTLELRV